MKMHASHANGLLHKSRALSGPAAAVIIVAIIAIGTGSWLYLSGNTIGSHSSTSSSSTAPASNVAGKITFNVYDLLSGNQANAPVVTVYPTAGMVLNGRTFSGAQVSDNITGSSSGVATTGLQYPPNMKLNVKVTLANYVTEWFDGVVSQGVTPAAQAQGTASQQLLYITKGGTYAITVTDDQGNSYTSNTSIGNFTNSGHCTTNNFCLGESTIRFTVTVRNTGTNTGFATSTNALTGNQWQDVLLFSTNGSSVQITQTPSVVRGTSTYYPVAIPDGVNSAGQADGSGVSQQTVNGVTTGGSWVAYLSVSKGTLAAGSTQTINIQQYLYGAIAYFTQNNGSWNTQATTTGAASEFYLKVGA